MDLFPFSSSLAVGPFTLPLFFLRAAAGGSSRPSDPFRNRRGSESCTRSFWANPTFVSKALLFVWETFTRVSETFVLLCSDVIFPCLAVRLMIPTSQLFIMPAPRGCLRKVRTDGSPVVCGTSEFPPSFDYQRFLPVASLRRSPTCSVATHALPCLTPGRRVLG